MPGRTMADASRPSEPALGTVPAGRSPADLHPPDLPYGRSVCTRLPCTITSVNRAAKKGPERRTEGVRDDELGDLEAAAGGLAARGGRRTPGEDGAGGSRGTHGPPVGVGRGLGAGGGGRPPTQALPHAEVRRLSHGGSSMSEPWGDCPMNPWTAAVLRRVPRG